MGKLLNLLMVMFVIDICLALFLGQGFTTLLLNIFDLNNWSQITLVDWLTTLATGIGVAVILAGTFVWKNDFVAFAGVVTVFLSYGSSILTLKQQIDATFPNSPISYLIVGPIFVTLIYTLFKFWRGWD